MPMTLLGRAPCLAQVTCFQPRLAGDGQAADKRLMKPVSAFPVARGSPGRRLAPLATLVHPTLGALHRADRDESPLAGRTIRKESGGAGGW